MSSVTPALSIATSVPVPIAMPTSAAASAGASLTPSPAIATTRPCGLADAAPRRSSARAGPRPRPRRCRAGAPPPPRWCALSPVSMTTRRPSCFSAAQRRRRRRLDRIGDRDHAGGLAVDRDEDRGRAVLAQLLGLRGQRRGVDAELDEEFRVAERDPPALDRPDHALAGRESKSVDRRGRDAARICGARRSPRPADARSPARRSRRAAAVRSRQSPRPGRPP